MTETSSSSSSPYDISTKLTAVRSENPGDAKRGRFDVFITTPSRKSPLKASFTGGGEVEEKTEYLSGVDPDEILTFKLFDEGSDEEVKHIEVPVKSLQSDFSSTYLVYDGITVSIDYEISRNGQKISRSRGSNIDDFIRTIGSAEKPWYLETASVYSAVKHTLAALLSSPLIKEWSASKTNVVAKTINEFLLTSADLIQSMTLYKKLFTKTEGDALIEQLDEYITHKLCKFDFLTDSIRLQLSESLLKLKGAIVSHSEWTIESSKAGTTNFLKFSNEKFLELQVISIKFITSIKEVFAALRSSGGNFGRILQIVTKYIEEATALVHVKLDAYSKSGKVFVSTYLDAKVNENSSWQDIVQMGSNKAINKVLSKAQPYVHTAVNWSTPSIVKAFKFSDPVLKIAVPYVYAVTANVKKTAETNQTASNLIDLVTNKSMQVILYSRAYAIPEELTGTYEELLKNVQADA